MVHGKRVELETMTQGAVATTQGAVRARKVTHTTIMHRQRHDATTCSLAQPAAAAAHLLVGKDQDGRAAHERVVNDGLELLAGAADAVPVLAVDNENEAIGVVEVVPPAAARQRQRQAA